jgi:hypothetical protein
MFYQFCRLSTVFLLLVSACYSQTTQNDGPNDASTPASEVEPVNAVQPNVLSGGLPYPFRYVHLAAETPKKATKQTPPADAKSAGPRMAGSATGYIDNALVGSQIRLRFDGDFDLQNPDRAEFFYPKCGCYRPADPHAPGPGTVPASKVNLQEIQMNVEYAPNRHFSFLAEVPFRFIQFTAPTPGIPSSSGIGDFRAGFKVALVSGEKTALTFQFRTYFPSGDSRLGLGTNHFSVEPTILYHQRLGERWTVAGEFGDWHPIGGSNSVAVHVTSPAGFAGDILLSGLGAGYDLVNTGNYRVTPIVEFVGWSILSGLATGGTTPHTGGISIVNIKVGTRVTFQGRNSIYVGYGHELTKTAWYTDIIRVEYRYAF